MNVWVVVEKIGRQTQSIVDAATLRGHRVSAFRPSNCDLLFQNGCLSINDVSIETIGPLPDIVLTRIPTTAADSALHMIKQLEFLGIRCVNSSAALEANRNKIRANTALVARGLPIPRTVVVIPQKDEAKKKKKFENILQCVPGPPWIIKLPQGSQGDGVVLAESSPSLLALLDTFIALNKPVLVQECIPEAMSSDIRAFIIGGKLVAAVRRQVSKDDFRANASRGGDGRILVGDDRLAYLAEEAAKTLGLEIAGVDLVSFQDDYLILDVNSSPGLLGIQKNLIDATETGAAHRDIASLIVEYIENEAIG